MPEPFATAVPLGLAALAGAGLGALHFGGLWWTVRRLPTSERPGLLMAGSLVLRLVLLAAGVFLVGQGRWENLAACLAGFVAARSVMVRRLGPIRMREGRSDPGGDADPPGDRRISEQ